MPPEPVASPAGASIESRLAAAGLPPLPRLAWLEVDLGALTGERPHAARPPAGRGGAGRGGQGRRVRHRHGGGGARRAPRRGRGPAGGDAGRGARAAGRGDRRADPGALPRPAGHVRRRPMAADLDLVAADDGSVEALAAASPARTPIAAHGARVHLAIDSGMGRGGLSPDRAPGAARRLLDAGLGALAGTWSHLATPEDPAAVAGQVERYEAALAGLRGAGIDPGTRHLDATVGLLGGTGPVYDMVRVGLAAYGVHPPELVLPPREAAIAEGLRPVVGLRTRAATVATVPSGGSIGYGGTWTAARPSLVATLPSGTRTAGHGPTRPDSWGVVRGRPRARRRADQQRRPGPGRHGRAGVLRGRRGRRSRSRRADRHDGPRPRRPSAARSPGRSSTRSRRAWPGSTPMAGGRSASGTSTVRPASSAAGRARSCRAYVPSVARSRSAMRVIPVTIRSSDTPEKLTRAWFGSWTTG